MTQHSLRSQIGVVFQDPHLFNDTVRANIAYGRPDATAEEIEAAARAAQAHDFIMALPEGYDDGGPGARAAGLSGGQRQRIAIARALLKDPPILVLDEATSALDSESEHLIQLALRHLLRGRTAFVIAHRLSTVRDADRIVVIEADDRGDGSHAELCEGGYYASLVAGSGSGSWASRIAGRHGGGGRWKDEDGSERQGGAPEGRRSRPSRLGASVLRVAIRPQPSNLRPSNLPSTL